MWLLVLSWSVAFAIIDFGPQLQLIVSEFPYSGWWGFDADLILQASKRLLDGQVVYSDPRLFYSPLAVILGVPATLVPREYSLLAYALFKVLLAVVVTLWLSRGSWLAVLGVLTFLPFINDVAPGNFMVPITAVMAVSTFGQERRRSGVALGLVAAAIPKPLLAPYFLWLIVHRRKTAEGAILTGAALTLVAAVIAGPESYLGWLRNMTHATAYISPWSGNYGVSAYLPDLAVPIAILVVAVTLLVVARAQENRSLVWVLAAGILVSPYAGPLTALPLLLALPILRPWPRVYAIALLQPLATISAALVGFVALLVGPVGAMGSGDRRHAAGTPEATTSGLPPQLPTPIAVGGNGVAAWLRGWRQGSTKP